VHLFWQTGRQTPLHQWRTCDHAEPQSSGRFEDWDELSAQRLCRKACRFWHREAHRQLHRAEMVRCSPYFARDGYEISQRQVLPMIGRDTQPQPGRASVARDLFRKCALLEQCESGAHLFAKRAAIKYEELFLWIVKIVEINRPQAEIVAALRELMGKEGRIE
jgi:hypothetical protein